MGKLSSFLDDLGTSYLQSEMGIDNNKSEEILKKQKFCSSCGNEVENGSTVCYQCGVNPQNVKNKKFCPYCGKSVNEEQVICLNCKESLENVNFNNASGGILLLCFLFPIIALFVYVANVNTRKEYANSCGKAGITGLVFLLVIGLFGILILFE